MSYVLSIALIMVFFLGATVLRLTTAVSRLLETLEELQLKFRHDPISLREIPTARKADHEE
jgi:hypothetical protein